MRRLSLVIAFGLGLAGPLNAQQMSFDNADADGDGRLSRDEYQVSRDRQFDSFDRNHDGVVSSNDFAQMSIFRNSLNKIDRILAIVDLDHDGVISRDELHAAGTPMFDEADIDHDGFLTEPEMDKLRTALAKRRRMSR